jgi:hypothetical protein
MRPRRSLLLLALAIAALGSPALRGTLAPQAEQALPWGGEESVAVELLTVPFYAVDDAGRPVVDLRADEVRLAVGDARIVPDTFDSFVSAAAPALRGEARRAAAQRARHVVLLLDRAFLGFEGWRNSQRAAIGLVDGLPADDRVTLMVNDPLKGLDTLLSAIRLDSSGRRKFRVAVERQLAAPNRLESDAEARYSPYVLGAGRNGVPGEQVHNAYEAGGALARSEYRSVGYDLADNLELLSLALGRSQGSKLLVLFSGGIDDTLYLEGEVGFRGVGSSDAFASWVDTRRAEPMVGRFERAYDSLAAAGVNLVTVNPFPSGAYGRDMLNHLTNKVGGVMVEDPNPTTLLARVESLTAARYELGVYAQKLPAGFAGKTARVVISRPGVTATSPARLPSQRKYRELLPHERKMLIVDLVQGGIVAPALSGQVRSASGSAGERRLRFDAERPPAVSGQPLDLYDVLIKVGEKGKPPELVSYGERLEVAVGEALGAEARIAKGTYVWAILAVEPGSGNVYLKRLQIAPPGAPGATRRQPG